MAARKTTKEPEVKPVAKKTSTTAKKPVEKKAAPKKASVKKAVTKPVKEVPVYTIPLEVQQLAKTLKAIRLEKGMSLLKLSELSGVGKTTIGEFERGLSAPKLDTVMKIASGLGYKLIPVMK